MDQIDEYEQGERVRSWLRQNGSSLVTGVAIGLACLGGWQWWQNKQQQQVFEAASTYLSFSQAMDAGEKNKAEAYLQVLERDFQDSPYPALAALRRAAELAGEGKPAEAVALLDAVPRDPAEPSLAALMDLRAARLLLTDGKAEEAMARVGGVDPSLYPATAAEIRGDAEMALGRREAARDAYRDALTAMDLAAPTRPLVEMKLTDAGGLPPEQPET